MIKKLNIQLYLKVILVSLFLKYLSAVELSIKIDNFQDENNTRKWVNFNECIYYEDPYMLPESCNSPVDFGNIEFIGVWTPINCTPSHLNCTFGEYFLNKGEHIEVVTFKMFKKSMLNWATYIKFNLSFEGSTTSYINQHKLANDGWNIANVTLPGYNYHSSLKIAIETVPESISNSLGELYDYYEDVKNINENQAQGSISKKEPHDQNFTNLTYDYKKRSFESFSNTDELGDYIFLDYIILYVHDHENANENSTTSKYENTTPPNDTCQPCPDKIDSEGELWSGVCAKETAKKPCKNDENFYKTWTCSNSSQFETPTPDFRNCSNRWVDEINQKVNGSEKISEEEASSYLNTIVENSNNASKYYGHEIINIVKLCGEIFTKIDEKTDFKAVEILTDSFGGIVQKLITNTQNWDEILLKSRTQTGLEIIKSLESSIFNLANRSSSVSYFRELKKFNEIQQEGGKRERINEESENKLLFPKAANKNKESYIELPNDWTKYFSNLSVKYTGIQLATYYSNNIFNFNNLRRESNAVYNKGNLSEAQSLINSNLLVFSFGDDSQAIAKPIKLNGTGVRIVFRHENNSWGTEINISRKLHDGEMPSPILGSSECVYLDDFGNLSPDGCKAIKKNSQSITICECNHLSSYAVLMDYHNYIGKDYHLKLITWILVPISLFCLFICLVVYSLPSVESLRTPRTFITSHLFISLFVANILFATVDRDYFFLTKGFCTSFGIMTHYAYLAVFSWTGLEGFTLYKMIYVVFENGNSRKLPQSLIAYGTPAAIVLITVIIAVARGDDAYETEMFCWLNGYYLWSFLGPIAVVLVFNFIVLILSLKKAHQSVKSAVNLGVKNQVCGDRKYFLIWIKGSFTLTILLGLTWTSGYFMLIDNSTISNIAAYVFTILNASQGIFLFIFHIVLNKKIRRSIWNQLHKWLPNLIPSKGHHYSVNRTMPKSNNTNSS